MFFSVIPLFFNSWRSFAFAAAHSALASWFTYLRNETSLIQHTNHSLTASLPIRLPSCCIGTLLDHQHVSTYPSQISPSAPSDHPIASVSNRPWPLCLSQWALRLLRPNSYHNYGFDNSAKPRKTSSKPSMNDPSISSDDLCIWVAIADTELRKHADVRQEMLSILQTIQEREETLKRGCQNILLSSIYSSQPKNVKDQSSEIVRILLFGWSHRSILWADSPGFPSGAIEFAVGDRLVGSFLPFWIAQSISTNRISHCSGKGSGSDSLWSCLRFHSTAVLYRNRKEGLQFYCILKLEGSNPLIQYSGLQQRLSQGRDGVR